MRIQCLATVAVAALWGCVASPEPMTCAPWGSPEEIADRPSPFDSVSTPQGEAWAKLCYSKPSARGRVVFGNLAQYDTLWRTGANEPTTLHLSAPAVVAGMEVEAGDYSIYTVPSPDPTAWSLVLNASTSQWGLTHDAVGAGGNQFYNAYTEDVRAQEVGRRPLQVDSIDFVEQLTASFEPAGQGAFILHIDWDHIRIPIPVQFTGATPEP